MSKFIVHFAFILAIILGISLINLATGQNISMAIGGEGEGGENLSQIEDPAIFGGVSFSDKPAPTPNEFDTLSNFEHPNPEKEGEELMRQKQEVLAKNLTNDKDFNAGKVKEMDKPPLVIPSSQNDKIIQIHVRSLLRGKKKEREHRINVEQKLNMAKQMSNNKLISDLANKEKNAMREADQFRAAYKAKLRRDMQNELNLEKDASQSWKNAGSGAEQQIAENRRIKRNADNIHVKKCIVQSHWWMEDIVHECPDMPGMMTYCCPEKKGKGCCYEPMPMSTAEKNVLFWPIGILVALIMFCFGQLEF